MRTLGKLDRQGDGDEQFRRKIEKQPGRSLKAKPVGRPRKTRGKAAGKGAGA